MKTILHIGQPKTGTTALQYALSGNRRVLSNFKISYPRLPRWSFAHHSLVPHFIGLDRTEPYLLRKLGPGRDLALAKSEQAWKKVELEVKESAPEMLVLSSEALFHATDDERMKSLGSLLRGISDKIELVIYLRDPASHALASLANQIQVHADFVWPGNRIRRAVIESYQRMDPDRIHVINYSGSTLYNSDVVDDFTQRFFPESVRLKKAKMRANPTMSAEAMAVMQQFVLANESYDRSRMSIKQQIFRKILARVDRYVGGYSKPRFLPDKRNAYLHSCRDLGWLKEQYNIDWLVESEEQPSYYQKVGFGSNQKISALCAFDSVREKKIRGIMQVIAPELTQAGL